MKRREFITLLGGAAANAWPVAGHAQKSAKVPRIGIIDDAPIWDHFRQGLRDLGYIDGQNIAFEYRSAEGQPVRLAIAASDLARLPVDIIMASGSAATFAVQQATTTIPIVMIAVGDPVRAGFVASLARPGGNVTGNTILGTQMSAKRLQLFKQVIPGLLRVAFLWNRSNLSHHAYLEEWRAVAPTLDVELIFVEVGSSDRFESAFATMMQKRPDGFLMTADPLHLSRIGWIIDFMAKNRLPAMFIVKENERYKIVSWSSSKRGGHRQAVSACPESAPTTVTIGRVCLVGLFRNWCIVHPLPWELPPGTCRGPEFF
jgi:putative ABC transport system substrate-binding protein